jgi:hypothetical protein
MNALSDKLDLLDQMQAQVDLLQLRYADLKDSLLTPEQRQQMADIDFEASEKLTAAKARIEALTAEIKAEAITIGVTVSGKHMQAVWSKPRVAWDSKALDGYAAGHPEILQFRSEGQPNISIRKISGK